MKARQDGAISGVAICQGKMLTASKKNHQLIESEDRGG
jgi:hypothetical protein